MHISDGPLEVRKSSSSSKVAAQRTRDASLSEQTTRKRTRDGEDYGHSPSPPKKQKVMKNHSAQSDIVSRSKPERSDKAPAPRPPTQQVAPPRAGEGVFIDWDTSGSEYMPSPKKAKPSSKASKSKSVAGKKTRDLPSKTSAKKNTTVKRLQEIDASGGCDFP